MYLHGIAAVSYTCDGGVKHYPVHRQPDTASSDTSSSDRTCPWTYGEGNLAGTENSCQPDRDFSMVIARLFVCIF